MRHLIHLACVLLAAAPSGMGAETAAVYQSVGTSTQRVKLELVFSTEGGGTAVDSSVTMEVSSNGDPSELRIGTEVPVPVTYSRDARGDTEDAPGAPKASFQYRNVGTNLTVLARSHEDGYRLRVSLELSTILGNQQIAGIDLPRFRTFNLRDDIVLRDGESAELASATDVDTGEIRRVRISLEVVR